MQPSDTFRPQILRAPLDYPVLGLIWIYQTFISPRKGYRCAHGVLHGGTGCSGYAKHAIRDHGIFAAVPLVRQRFKDCKTASEELQRRSAEKAERKRNSGNSDAACCLAEGCEMGGDAISCCGSKSRGAGNAGGCDVPDCGGGADACACTPW